MSDSRRSGPTLSSTMFEASELLDMYADMLRARGVDAAWPDRVRAEIVVYRTGHGWDPDGYGQDDRHPAEEQ